jgi:hypothetical protein
MACHAGPLMRSFDLGSRATQLLRQLDQYLAAKTISFGLTSFQMLNDFRRNEVGHGIVGTAIDFQHINGRLKSAPHDLLELKLHSLILGALQNRHGHPPLPAAIE